MVDAYGKSAIYSLSFILCLLSIVSSLLRSIIPYSHCAFSSFPAILSFFFCLFIHTVEYQHLVRPNIVLNHKIFGFLTFLCFLTPTIMVMTFLHQLLFY